MSSNSDNLHKAKTVKNDEFFTQLKDIEKELSFYNTSQFYDKIVYCNCDDPFQSNFIKYFLMNFNRFHLKGLYASGFRVAPFMDTEDTAYMLKVFSTTGTDKDLSFNESVEFLKNNWKQLCTKMEGHYLIDESLYYEPGDFRSDMSNDLLDEADIICTNSPFSCFKEYLPYIIESGKMFLVVGNINAVTYKEIFKYVVEDKLWLGNKTIYFFLTPDGTKKRFGNTVWFTNMDTGKIHKPLTLKKSYDSTYEHYDHYDAINIDKVEDIPKDYYGKIGVPLTYLLKHCKEQFKVVGLLNYGSYAEGTNWYQSKGESKILVNGRCPYIRILIQRVEE